MGVRVGLSISNNYCLPREFLTRAPSNLNTKPLIAGVFSCELAQIGPENGFRVSLSNPDN
jgi:hypothetical protein